MPALNLSSRQTSLERYIWEMHQYNVYTQDSSREVKDVVKWKPTFEGEEPPF